LEGLGARGEGEAFWIEVVAVDVVDVVDVVGYEFGEVVDLAVGVGE
jgi:hypothetical protein